MVILEDATDSDYGQVRLNGPCTVLVHASSGTSVITFSVASVPPEGVNPGPYSTIHKIDFADESVTEYAFNIEIHGAYWLRASLDAESGSITVKTL